MRKKIVFYLKNSNLISELYFIIGTILVNFLKLFVRAQSKTALFVSYGGKKMNDSPYAIYEAMKHDKRFSDWKLVWAFIDPQSFEIKNKVKIDSFSYFKMCLTARVWVTNSGIKRYLNFSGKNTYFINTWHGIPLKKIGIDEIGVKKSRIFARKWFEFKNADMNLYHSNYDFAILKHVFDAEKSTFFNYGLPRNDVLYANYDNKALKQSIKKKLGIADDKKVILYAPTVRGNQLARSKQNVFKNPFNFDRWKIEFPNCVILFRAHYYVDEEENTDFDNVIDVTNYKSIEDLYLVADALISDYSSVFFDYSILGRPMFCYAYDLKDYSAYQGLYLNPSEILSNVSKTENELIQQIKENGLVQNDKSSIAFRNKFIGLDKGNAANKILDQVIKNVEK